MDPRLTAMIAPFAFVDGLHRLVLDDGTRVVVKRRRHAPHGFFAIEAHGLALLRDTRTLRVPLLHGAARDAIVLEDLGTGRASEQSWQRAGRALARLHAHTSSTFGLDRDGWCGDSPQRNTQTKDGWRTRAPVYNLYHLLNHLNLFGSTYLGGVLTALRGA